MAKDSLNYKVQRGYDNARTAWLIQTGQYEEAIPLLRKTIAQQKGSIARARLNYLLGQLCRETGKRDEAYAALRKVLRANPPYEMSLNARVLQSEMTDKSRATGMIRKLQRMAKKSTNKPYADQIYLAIGNIYMNTSDTLRCIYAWEKGLLESKGGTAKATLLLNLANLYWEREEYVDAARCYKDCLATMDKEKEEHAHVEQRSKALEGLSEPLSAIELQDSLQELAKLPEAERLAVAERLAEEYKKKEKEEAKRQAEEGNANTASNTSAVNNTAFRPQMQSGGQSAGGWYYSIPNTVAQGKAAFFRKWGMRRNTDYWRWADKSGFAVDGTLPDAIAALENDDTWDTADIDTTDIALPDSAEDDPRNKAYYLKQIPLTEEQMATSHQILSDALYQAGVLEQERLENFPLARKTLLRFTTGYPDHQSVGDAYYHLFLTCGRLALEDEAEMYRRKVIDDFPENAYAQLLSNPQYELIARGGRHLEDSMYADAYAAYLQGNYAHVKANYDFSTENYPQGKHRARFMFVNAMGQLYSGNKDEFLNLLKELVENYSSEEITQLASEIMKGIKEGRLLNDGPWDTSGIWARRAFGAESDSTASADTLRDDRLGDFAFVLAYPKGALNEDQLLFEMARYNFSSFMVRNFELEISDLGDISILAVQGFRSYDEVHAYAQRLYSDRHMATVLEGIRSLLILKENLLLLGTRYSFDDYASFYQEHFAPMDIPEELQFDMDSETIIRGEDEVPDDTGQGTREEDANESEEEYEESEDDFPFGF